MTPFKQAREVNRIKITDSHLTVRGCEAVKKEDRTQMHNVKEKGFNKGPDRRYINKTMKHTT